MLLCAEVLGIIRSKHVITVCPSPLSAHYISSAHRNNYYYRRCHRPGHLASELMTAAPADQTGNPPPPVLTILLSPYQISISLRVSWKLKDRDIKLAWPLFLFPTLRVHHSFLRIHQDFHLAGGLCA